MATTTVKRINADATEDEFTYINNYNARYNLVSCILQERFKRHPMLNDWYEKFAEVDKQVTLSRTMKFFLWCDDEWNIVYVVKAS